MPASPRPSRLAHGPFPDLDLYRRLPSRPAEALETQAREAEAAARAVEGVTNSDGGSAWSSSIWRW
jgi:PmbA protein